MKIGDIVCRKKYGKDICFKITDIQDDVYYLTGIEYRLVADSDESDLELSDFSSEKSDIIVESRPCLKGSVLHIDGDKHYLDMCLKKYEEFNINVHGYFMKENEKLNAEVIAVFPNKVKISVDNLEDFQLAEEKLKVGSYLRIADNDNAVLIAIIENFNIEVGINHDGSPNRKYILEANPLGIIRNGKFERGGDTLAIPPKSKRKIIRRIVLP